MGNANAAADPSKITITVPGIYYLRHNAYYSISGGDAISHYEYSYIYVNGAARLIKYATLTYGGGSGYNFSTGVLANAAVSAGAASTFVTKTVDPRLFFDIGDTVHVHDSDTAIGTVTSLTDNDINLTAVTGVAIAEDDEIINASPVELILCFEK